LLLCSLSATGGYLIEQSPSLNNCMWVNNTGGPVPAGTYQLEVNIRDSKADSVRPNDSPGAVPQLASLDREIIVPEIPEGQSAEAVDLGILELAHPQDRASAQ